MYAYVEIRSQKAVGTYPKQGPDRYVMVQVVPRQAKRLISLNRKAARNRGIQLIWCGEGYSRRQQTSQSMYNQAVSKANELADALNLAFELGYEG